MKISVVVLVLVSLFTHSAHADERALRISMSLPNVLYYGHTGETRTGEVVVSGTARNEGSKLFISDVQIAANLPEGTTFGTSVRKSLLSLFKETVAFSTSHAILRLQLEKKMRAETFRRTALSFNQTEIQISAIPVRFAERGVPCHILETHLYANASNEVESIQVEVSSRGAKSKRSLAGLTPQFESLNPWLAIDWMRKEQEIMMMLFRARSPFDDEAVWEAVMRQDAERILEKISLVAPKVLTPEEKKAKEDAEMKGCMGCGCFLVSAGAASLATVGWVVYHLIW